MRKPKQRKGERLSEYVMRLYDWKQSQDKKDGVQKAQDVARDVAKDLESVLENEDAGNDAIREAALSAQDALNSIVLLLRAS